MIVCRKCNTQNRDSDAFCGSCGAFLEWTGQRVDPEPLPEVVEEEASAAGAEPKGGLLERMSRAVTAVIAPAQAGDDKAGAWTGFGKDAGAGAGAGTPPRPGVAAPAPRAPGAPGAPPPAPGAAAPPAPPGARPGPPAPPAPPGPPRPGGAGAAPAPPRPPGAGGAPPAPPAPPRPPGAGGAPPAPPAPPRPPGVGGAAAAPPAPPAPPSPPAPAAPAGPGGSAGPGAPAAPLAPPRPPGGAAAPPPPAPRPGAHAAPGAGAADVAADPKPLKPPTQPTPPPDASGLLVAVDSVAEARATEPAEVTPQRVPERVAKVTKTKPTRKLRPGDLICGECGEGNPPTRKFCSRCGEELATAEVVKTPWWRKLMFWRRGPRTLEAGTRPGRGGTKPDRKSRVFGGYRRIRAIFGTVLVAVTILSIFVAPIRTQLNDTLGDPGGKVRDLWGRWFDPSYVPVRPEATSATHEVPGHPGSFAMDIDKQTYWAAPRGPRIKRPGIVVDFGREVDLAELIVSSGAIEADFNKYYRPSALHLVYGPNASEDVRLDDVAKDQVFKLKKADNVTQVTIFVASVFPEPAARQVAIRELEFQVLDQ